MNSNDEIEVIEGTISRVIYRSQNYMVSVVETIDGPITVTGPSFDYDKNLKYSLSGRYVEHPKYGFQFELYTIDKCLPSAKDEIIKYLSSPIFKKVGIKAAEKIYEVFGDETLRIIKSDPNCLDEVNLSDVQRQSIKDVFMLDDDFTSECIFSLISHGFTSKEAHLIFNHYKEDTLDVLKDNPFRFYLEVYGISFQRLIECSKKMEFDNFEIKYKEAYLIYLFKETSFNLGDIFLYPKDFSSKYISNYDDFDDILELCIKDNYLVKEDNRYYLKQDFDDEVFISSYLKKSKNNSLEVDGENLSISIFDMSNSESIEYDSKQIVAIRNFFDYDISLIVGGPGTGKTTIIKAMVELFNNFFPFNNIVVAAPTGRAAKRINEICNVQSKTIHSLLRWNKDDNSFIYNESNPLLYDAIIIDEFSMVDNSLFAALLKAASHTSKICIIGDDNQLPSIRQGNLLHDLIKSNTFPLVRLTTIHRQKEGNEIIKLANDIVNNKVDLDSYNSDIKFVDIKTINKNDIVNMINDNINDGYEFDNIQVLSPMYRGQFGIDSLNTSLQSSFNPKDEVKVEKRVFDCLYRENDKILQLKNRPDEDVYNGDIGTLIEINLDEREFLIKYSDNYIYYSFDDLNVISLAYAMSVHKAQGSEYDIVYFVCSKEHSLMLYKKLVYTAISRAKSKLIIIGDRNTFINAINKDIRERKTSLINRLK